MKCSKCGKADCWHHPICEALDKLDISADFTAKPANLSIDQLPQCQSCFGLLRPDIGPGIIKLLFRYSVNIFSQFSRIAGLKMTLNSYLNPFEVWFGESLDSNNLETAFEESKKADLILVIGTSSQVYPVAMIAPDAADLGIPVIEINLDTTPKTDSFMYHFHGKSGEILPLIVNQMKSDI